MNADPNSELYRTPGLVHEFFSQAGSLHLHVDGGDDPHLALEIVLRLEREGCLGKVNKVKASVAGPQRALLPETYESHTPATAGVEQFEYFATAWLPSREKAVEVLSQIIKSLQSRTGVVVEVERVIARVDTADEWIPMKANNAIAPIRSQEVGWEASATLPFEIHHGIDLPLDSSLSLEDLLKDTTTLGLVVGGWFSFTRRGQLSYRSNAFSQAVGLKELVFKEHQILSDYLRGRGLSCRVRTVVEEVLGVWRIAQDGRVGAGASANSVSVAR
jgi:hypothetical protein